MNVILSGQNGECLRQIRWMNSRVVSNSGMKIMLISVTRVSCEFPVPLFAEASCNSRNAVM